MCLHGALCSIPDNLISNMTSFRKDVLTFDQTPGVEDVCKNRIYACIVPYDLFHLMTTFMKKNVLTIAACVISFNLICTITIFCKIRILTL